MSKIAHRVLGWFDEHGRKDLPWQQDPTPYRVWISEIMLQQTQVATVIPYFLRFMTSFPSVNDLANASLDDVLHHWSGLGYYARARNMHKTAITLRDQNNGELPLEIDAMQKLPGIGRSTAGAILALSGKQRHPILDGNVKRVLTRYRAIEGWPGKTSIANKLWEIAENYTPEERVDDYTQAMMDLGATLCTRSRPQCEICPLSDDCEARRLGRQSDYPGKQAKKLKPLKTTQMLLVHCDGELYLRRRPESGIWGGLWSLPELPDDDEVNDWCAQTLNVAASQIDRWDTLRHSFSHFDLDIKPIAVRLNSNPSKVADSDQELWYTLAQPPGVGLAAPVKTLIDCLQQTGSN